MKPGDLGRHSLLYFCAKAGPAGVTFAMLAALTRLLSPSEYGVFALTSAWVLLGNAVLFQWLRLSTLRFLPAHRDARKEFTSTVFGGFLALSSLVAVLGVLCSLALSELPPGLVLAAVGMLLAVAANEAVLEFSRADLRPDEYLVASMVRAVVGLVAGLLLVRLGLAAVGAVLGLALGAGAAAVVTGRRIARDVRASAFRLPILRGLAAYGLPMTVGFALEFILSMSDRLLIGWLLDNDAVGRYAVAYDLPRQSLGVIIASLALGALPLAVRAVEEGDRAAIQRQLTSNAKSIGLLGFPAAVGLALVAPNLAWIFFGEAFRAEIAVLTPLITIGVLFHGVRTYYLDHAFQLARRPGVQVRVAGIAAVVNIAANLFWLPRFGLTGAAYATILAYGVAAAASWVLGRRYFEMPLPWRPLSALAASAVVMGIALWPLRELRGIGALVLQVLVGVGIYFLILGLCDVSGARRRLLGLFR